MRYRVLGAASVLAIGVALAQTASSPWTVTLTPPNPLRIGICQAVQLTLQNAAGTDVPRNKQGNRITMADFDMSVSGASVAGHNIDAYHYEVCGCQGAAPGTVAKVKASYPAKALAAAAVVPNVHFEREATFSVGVAVGQSNPPACTAPPPPPPTASTSQPPAQPAAPSAPSAPAAPSALPTPPPAAAPPPPPPAAPSPASPPPSGPASPSDSPPDSAPSADIPPMPEMPEIPDMPDPIASQQPLPPIDVSKEEDPLTMFAALMPVFKSPRCVNCHGGTNPATNLNHEGGEQDVQLDAEGNMALIWTGSNEGCLDCHDSEDAKTWRLAQKHFSFVGRDTKQLCRQLRSDPKRLFNLTNAKGRADFLKHLQEDKLIGVGFVGDGGTGATPAPPPLSKARFLQLARHWLEDGEGACADLWNGTITETTTSSQKVTFAPAAGGREVKADARITITVLESKATAAVQWDARDFTDVPTRECETYNHNSLSAIKNNVPIELHVVVNTKPLPKSVAAAVPAAPALPPGVALPPGFQMPTAPAVGESFFRYQGKSLLAGKRRSDIRSLPGCKQTVTEAKYDYHLEGAMLALTVNPKDPNHFKGEKKIPIPAGTRTITWDLTHVRE